MVGQFRKVYLHIPTKILHFLTPAANFYVKDVAEDFSFYLSNLAEYLSQPAFTCSKLTIETLEQGAKYVQS